MGVSRRAVIVLAVLLAWHIFNSEASGFSLMQRSISLTLDIRDTAGKPVPGAQITIFNERGVMTYQSTSDLSAFLKTTILPGKYRLFASYGLLRYLDDFNVPPDHPGLVRVIELSEEPARKGRSILATYILPLLTISFSASLSAFFSIWVWRRKKKEERKNSLKLLKEYVCNDLTGMESYIQNLFKDAYENRYIARKEIEKLHEGAPYLNATDKLEKRMEFWEDKLGLQLIERLPERAAGFQAMKEALRSMKSMLSDRQTDWLDSQEEDMKKALQNLNGGLMKSCGDVRANT